MSFSYRFLVHFVFAYTCIEGLIVNITYPSFVAYLLKDLVILAIYASMVTEQRPSSGSVKKIGGGLMVFCLMMAFYLLMPTPVSLMGELVALKQRLFYIPLVYVGYFYTRTPDDVGRLIRLLTWTAIPTAAFGIYLYFAGPAALQAMGGNYAAVVSSTTGASGVSFYRVPGSFTSPGQFALFCMTQAVVLTSVLFIPTAPRRTKLLTGAALLLCIGGLLVSGSRGPLLIYVLCLGLALLYMGRLSTIGIAALAVYTVGTVAFTYFGIGVQERVGSVMSEENYDRFRNTVLGGNFYLRLLDEPLGRGLGVATIAARHFTSWTDLFFVESYVALIAEETGFFGLLALTMMVWAIVSHLFGERNVVKRVDWSPFWIFIVLLIFQVIALMPSGTLVDSAPGNLYFWFLIGVAIRLADLARPGGAYTPPRQPAAHYAYHPTLPPSQ